MSGKICHFVLFVVVLLLVDVCSCFMTLCRVFIFSLLSFIKEKCRLISPSFLCVCPPYELLN
jgi:hypothetical protein